MEVIPDDFPLIEDRLHHYVDDEFAFVFTTGGTGLTPDDVTPEATTRGHRARRARDRRGDARRVAAPDAHGDALARHVRRRAPHADRQLPRQPEGDRASCSPSSRRCSSTPPRPWCARVAAPAAIELDGLTRRYGERVGARGRHARARPRARRSSSSAPTARASRRCCACSPRCCVRTAATARVLGRELPRDGWAVRGRIGLLGHEPLLYRDLTAPREPALPRPPARRRRSPASRSCSSASACALRADDPVTPTRAGWCSGWRSPAPSCTTPSCCCSTSRARTSTPRPPSSSSR